MSHVCVWYPGSIHLSIRNEFQDQMNPKLEIILVHMYFFHLFCKQNKYTNNFSPNTMYMSTSFGTKTIEVLYRFHFSYTLPHWSKTFAFLQSFPLSLTHTTHTHIPHSHTTHSRTTHSRTTHTHTHTCYLCSYQPHRITICNSSYILFISICSHVL